MIHKMPRGLPHDVMADMSALFFDEEVCTDWFIRHHYPAGPVCPDCGADISNPQALQSFWQLSRFTCPGCGSQPRATKGTLLEGASITPRQLIIICWMIALAADLTTIASTVGVTTETIRSWRDRLTEVAQ